MSGDFRCAEAWLVRPGLVDYDQALELQLATLHARAEGRIPDTVLLLEHAPVITLGRAADPAHVLVSPDELAGCGIALREAGRGGDVTLHAPGQLVGYPIVDLRERARDVHRYLRDLEEVLIRALAGWEIEAGRIPGLTGVWVGTEKVAAIGVGVKRWIAYHGFALNVDVELSLFDLIVPCGLAGRGVTSVARLLGCELPGHERRAAGDDVTAGAGNGASGVNLCPGVEEAAGQVAAAWPGVLGSRLIELSGQQWAEVMQGFSSSTTTASRNTRTTVGSHCVPAPSLITRAASVGESAER